MFVCIDIVKQNTVHLSPLIFSYSAQCNKTKYETMMLNYVNKCNFKKLLIYIRKNYRAQLSLRSVCVALHSGLVHFSLAFLLTLHNNNYYN